MKDPYFSSFKKMKNGLQRTTEVDRVESNFDDFRVSFLRDRVPKDRTCFNVSCDFDPMKIRWTVTEVHWAHILHRPPTASPVELGTGVLWVSTGTHPCGSPSRQDDGETRAPALRTLDDVLRLSRRCGL